MKPGVDAKTIDLHRETVSRITELIRNSDFNVNRLADERLRKLEALYRELQTHSADLLEDIRAKRVSHEEPEQFGNYLIPFCVTFFLVTIGLYAFIDEHFGQKSYDYLLIMGVVSSISLVLGLCLYRFFRVGALEIAIIPLSFGIFEMALQLDSKPADIDRAGLKLHLALSALGALMSLAGSTFAWLKFGGRRTGRSLFELMNFLRRYYSLESLKKGYLTATLFWNGGLLVQLYTLLLK